jgi:protein-tyrosine phosphatase
MIDLHSHLLPAVDDGSRSVEQSVKVLTSMAQEGLTDICLTPHLRATRIEARPPAAHDQAFQSLIAQAPSLPRLHRGAEVMLDHPLPRQVAAARRITLAGSRYILVEFPRMVSSEIVGHAIAQVGELGLVPLVAHPERYSSCSPDAVRHWRTLGAKMQVDATTLLSPQARGRRARQLVAEGLADILAGDNHGDDRSVATGARFLRAQDGAEQVELLVVQNPRAILADAAVAPVPPIRIRQSWMHRIKEFLESGE